jgi:hypothetical protein
MYTVETTLKDLEQGRITKEESELFTSYISVWAKYDEVSTKLYEFLKNKYIARIENATLAELKAIKEELRWVPESAAKSLMFRAIIMKEDELNG